MRPDSPPAPVPPKKAVSEGAREAPVRSRLLSSGGDRGSGRRFGGGRLVLVLGQGRRAPVGLVEVDVESPGPLGEDALLGDEAMVAAAAAALMGDVHGTLVWPKRLVVVVGDRGMLRFSV